jgi:hypothetical protein
VGLIVLGLLLASRPERARLILWASERPEDLRFAREDVEVAAQTEFVVLTGEGVFVRRRRFALLSARPPAIAVAHIQIDHHAPLAWTPAQRAAVAAAVLQLARSRAIRRVQVDFEVRRSEQSILLDLLNDVRRGLPRDVKLSMTALASWCDTETWLERAPVDEIVPMLFRLGQGGQRIKANLEAGGDFTEPRCREALAVSSDEPLRRAPAGRRVYLFSPRSWTAASYANVREEVAEWTSGGG